MSELVGSVFLTAILATLLYFMIASRNRWGFDTTIGLSVPILLIIGITFTGFSAIMAFATILIGFLLAWLFNKIVQ